MFVRLGVRFAKLVLSVRDAISPRNWTLRAKGTYQCLKFFDNTRSVIKLCKITFEFNLRRGQPCTDREPTPYPQ